MKTKVTKLLVLVFMAISVLPTASACTPRSQQLKILNWGDYMSYEAYKTEFPKYYKERTGKKIKVVYLPNGDNEIMYSTLKTGGKTIDYDLICPSEYMLQQMMRENMIQKISRNEDNSYTNIDSDLVDGIYSKLRGLTYEYDGEVYNYDDYGIPYMWGTVGILYNFNEVTQAEVESWETLLNPTGKHVNKVTMKDSVRDAFFIAAVHAYNKANDNELTNMFGQPGHSAKVQEVVDDVSTTTINNVSAVLTNQASKVYYETDEGKGQVVAGTANMGLMWSGDAVWAFDEDLNASRNAVTAAYYVPHEGSNYWADYFAIPTTAVNKEAAEIFMEFLLTKEIAKMNIEETGYTSAVQIASEEYRDELAEDEEFWNQPKINALGDRKEWYIQMYLDTFLPTDEVLDRCAIMNDFGNKISEINNMWSAVRTG